MIQAFELPVCTVCLEQAEVEMFNDENRSIGPYCGSCGMALIEWIKSHREYLRDQKRLGRMQEKE